MSQPLLSRQIKALARHMAHLDSAITRSLMIATSTQRPSTMALRAPAVFS
ncbi:MAG TPA: hypothetical protein VIP51_01060 [Eoetvoesiella sp.]